MERHRAFIALLALVAGLIIGVAARPTPAAAAVSGTVVFIKDHNVWIMPAGAPGSAHPITADGTSASPYSIPALDDFGVVYAVTANGVGDIVRMDHAGNRLGPPFRPATARTQIDAIRPSPDGQVITFTSFEFDRVFDPGTGTFILTPVFFVDFAFADGRDSSSISHLLDASYAAWYGPDRVIFDPVFADELGGSRFDGYDLYVRGEATSARWFDTCRHSGNILNPFPDGCDIVTVPDLSRDLERLAAVDPRPSLSEAPGIVVWELNGPPPAPPSRACGFEETAGIGSINNVMWSPDGDALMWDYTASAIDAGPPPDPGLYLATGFDSRSCAASFSSAQLVVSDAAQPYWSPVAFGTIPPVSDFEPLVPERVLETRPEGGQVGYSGPKPGPEAVIELDVTGVGASQVPDSAEAVVLNVTGVDATAAGFVTVWPCGTDRPTASNLNLVAGATSPNLVIARVGAGGRVCVSTQSGTHLIADVAGYFPGGSSYEPLVPERVLETRPEGGQVGYSGPKPGPEAVIELDVTGVGASQVPDSAEAVVLNVTGVDATAAGFVTVWPCGTDRPTASNLNLVAGATSPNLVIARVGAGGRVCVSTQSGTHLIADVAGYFPGGSSYEPLVPERVLETRPEGGQVGYSGPKPGPEAVIELDVTGVGASQVPDSAEAVVLNVTGVDATAAGFVTVWPCGTDRPTASNLNLVAGATSPNLVIARVGAGGRVCLSTQSGTHLIADVAGYFPAG